MPTSNHLFMGFIVLGLVFFFYACCIAAKPASGTTEWINYICGRKLTFCPAQNSLIKFDIIPISILTLIAFGLMLLSAAFPLRPDNTTPFSELLEIPMFAIGNGHFYPSQVMWVMTVPLIYVFLKNLTGGYFIPICGVILLFLDAASFILSQNTAATGAGLFVLTAFYLTYRYTTAPKKLYLPFIGIAFGIAISFNAAATFVLIGIIAIFVIKEISLYLINKDKKQTIIRSVLFIAFCIILPMAIYFTITGLATSFANAWSIFAVQFRSFEFYSFQLLSSLSPMVFIGGILALPCCIYQIVKAKDGISLFVLIPFTVYILTIFISGLTGLLPIFAIPVISRGFSALENRKLKAWIFAYLFTAALYLGSIFALAAI